MTLIDSVYRRYESIKLQEVLKRSRQEEGLTLEMSDAEVYSVRARRVGRELVVYVLEKYEKEEINVNEWESEKEVGEESVGIVEMVQRCSEETGAQALLEDVDLEERLEGKGCHMQIEAFVK